jgi:hypothetical protein
MHTTASKFAYQRSGVVVVVRLRDEREVVDIDSSGPVVVGAFLLRIWKMVEADEHSVFRQDGIEVV